MKTTFFIITIALMTAMVACQKESDLFDELSLEDKLAVEGMHEAFEMANLYNDSLVWCSDPDNNCSDQFISYCDSIFHHHNNLYDTHHNNYSHNNVEDDHHHSAVSEHHHGDAEHHEEDDDDHEGHNLEGHLEMIELRGHHVLYHPE